MDPVSKAYLLATGVSTALGASDEGGAISSSIHSLNFVGDSVAATSDANGNITVQVYNSPPASLIDGGNF